MMAAIYCNSREPRGPRRSAGTPSSLNDALADLFPGAASLGIGLELSEPAVKLDLELVGHRDRLGYGGNALPDELDEPDALVDGQIKDLGHRERSHGVK